VNVIFVAKPLLEQGAEPPSKATVTPSFKYGMASKADLIVAAFALYAISDVL
jgi:hypothetical protein